MRKPVYAICKQQRHRSACASVQSDQHLIVRFIDSIIPLVSIPKFSNLYLASVAALAGLSLPWAQTSKTGFLMTRLNYILTNNVDLDLTAVSCYYTPLHKKWRGIMLYPPNFEYLSAVHPSVRANIRGLGASLSMIMQFIPLRIH